MVEEGCLTPTFGLLSYLSSTAQASCLGMVHSSIDQQLRRCHQDTVTGQSDLGNTLDEVFLLPVTLGLHQMNSRS